MADESAPAVPPARECNPAIVPPRLNPDIALLALVVFAVPLAIDPFGLRPFVPPKQAVLLGGAALVALAMAARVLRNAWRAPPPPGASQAFARARLDPWLVGAALAFWAWSLIVVTPRALNPALHLGFGWAFVSAYLVIFLAATRCTRQARIAASQRTIALLLGAVAVATLAMACHACLQAAGADPLAWIVGRPVRESGRWRIFATTGNPAWTAEFLAAGAPVAVWWASRFTPGARLLWLLFAAAILPTGSRLGLAALLVGAAIHACLRRRDHAAQPVPRKWMAALFGGTLVLAALAWLLHGQGYAAALLRWDDFGSISGRLRLWQASLHLIASRPLDGHGLEHFALVLPDGLRVVAASLDPLARSRMPALLTDHAHNDFLETAVETGIPGAMLLLALFAAGARAAWRAMGASGTPAIEASDTGPAPSAIPALAASLAVLAMLAVFSAPLHTPATALLFWLVAGCLPGSTTRVSPLPARGVRRGWRLGGGLAAACAMLAAMAWSGYRAATLLAENRQVAAAAGMALAGHTRAAAHAYGNALVRAPWDHEAGVALASLLIDDHRPDAALHVLDQADAWSRSREGWLARAQALMSKGDDRAALQVTRRTTAAVPDFLRAGLLQAHLAASLGRTREASNAWHQILLSPQRSPRALQVKAEAAEALSTLESAEPAPKSAPTGRP